MFAASSKLIVGIADLKTSVNPSDVVITYALGSCLGITAHDPVAQVGGMVHVMTPSSTLDAARAQRSPATYVDTGVNLLINECLRLGAQNAATAAATCSRSAAAILSRFVRSSGNSESSSAGTMSAAVTRAPCR
jgi:chemotaxis receptor (MCP) glutamine deamidase CheD